MLCYNELTTEQSERLRRVFGETNRVQGKFSLFRSKTDDDGVVHESVCAYGLLYENHPSFGRWDNSIGVYIPLDKTGQRMKADQLHSYYHIEMWFDISNRNDRMNWTFADFADWFRLGAPPDWWPNRKP